MLYRYEPTGRLRDKKLGVGHARNETEVGQVYGCCMLDGGGILLSNSSGWYYIYDKDFLFKERGNPVDKRHVGIRPQLMDNLDNGRHEGF